MYSNISGVKIKAGKRRGNVMDYVRILYTYIVEDFDGLNITIYTKNNKSENKNTVCVSSSSIGIGIPKWFFIEFYQGQSQSLPLTK